MMIMEHAILPVRPGAEEEFERAFTSARALISRQPGFQNLSLSRSIESPNLYLLLVEWDSVEAHTQGFRASPEYEEWKKLLHHFYEPIPVVEHYRAIGHVGELGAQVEAMIDREDGRIAQERLSEIEAGTTRAISADEAAREL